MVHKHLLDEMTFHGALRGIFSHSLFDLSTSRPSCHIQECAKHYDVMFFLRVPYDTLKRRREERQTYVTQSECFPALAHFFLKPPSCILSSCSPNPHLSSILVDVQKALLLTFPKILSPPQPVTCGPILQITLTISFTPLTKSLMKRCLWEGMWKQGR